MLSNREGTSALADARQGISRDKIRRRFMVCVLIPTGESFTKSPDKSKVLDHFWGAYYVFLSTDLNGLQRDPRTGTFLAPSESRCHWPLLMGK